jgi:hypothetical protein
MLGESIVRLAAPGLEAEMMNILRRIKQGEKIDHYHFADIGTVLFCMSRSPFPNL